MLNVPVLMIIFNRPELTRRVFEQVRRARPNRLFVAADGPRTPEEAGRCAEARAIVDEVKWECDVQARFSDVNQGCRVGPASAITWAFEQCEQMIILEDDCLPRPSFFPYCEELLERYRDDERVMTVSGDNFQLGSRQMPYSYYFSRYSHTWGWASWRRAWSHYDIGMRRWEELRDTPWLLDLLGDAGWAEYWGRLFDLTFAGMISTCWDYQWCFASWSQNALTALPSVNLVTNLGFGRDSTHTVDASNPLSGLPTEDLAFPLRHPWGLIWDRAADRFTYDHCIAPVRQSKFRRFLGRARGAIRSGRVNRLLRKLPGCPACSEGDGPSLAGALGTVVK